MRSEAYSSCKGVELGSGVVIWDKLPSTFAYVESLKFSSFCHDGHPLYSSFVKYTSGTSYLPVIANDWDNFVRYDRYTGPFKYSIYSITYSVTANFIITFFLTIIVFINTQSKSNRKTSYMIKLGALLASINLLIFFVRVTKNVKESYSNLGVVSSGSFLDLLWTDKVFAGIDLVVVFLLQISQVQIVMRFFDRFHEKRLVLYSGLFFTILSELLWVIPTFAPVPIEDSDSDIDILPPFVYLFRIALSSCYASIVCFHILIKKHICFRGRMIVLTILTIVAVLLHPAFFIVDVSNIWIDDLSEIFNTTCYLASTVLVLEWTKRVHTIERKMQASSVLGRPIYEDEEQNIHFAKYALKMQNAIARNSDEDMNVNPKLSMPTAFADHGSNISGGISSKHTASSIFLTDQSSYHQQQGEDYVTQFKKPDTFWRKCHHVLDSIIYYTDNVIVNGLAGSRTIGSSSNESDEKYKIGRVRKMVGLDAPDDVYLYRKAKITFDSEDENTEGFDDSDEADDDTDLEVGPSSLDHSHYS